MIPFPGGICPNQNLRAVPSVFTNGLPISNGLFLVTMDFGTVFNGSNCWLEVLIFKT